MEFSELTFTTLAFWDDFCAKHIINPKERPAFIMRRNLWIRNGLENGLSGIVMRDESSICGFALDMPISIAPVPLMGTNLCIIICNWISPIFANPKHKHELFEHEIEHIRARGFGGVALVNLNIHDDVIWESLGFEIINSISFFGSKVNVFFLNFGMARPPVLIEAAKLARSATMPFAIDLFYQSFCPIGAMALARILHQSGELYGSTEFRIHDTATRDEVLTYGTIGGIFVDGIDVSKRVLSGVPLSEIIEIYTVFG